jgi:hypothetical protein
MDEIIEKDKITFNTNIPNIEAPKSNQQAQWNEKLEQAAKEIGEASKGYKLMHIREARKASGAYNRLMILGIIMSPLSGVLSAIETVVDPEIDPTLPIISIILAFIAGVIIAMVKFGRYDEVSNANKQAAARYTSIESNVRRQLGLYRDDRVSATPYMEWLESKFEELFLSAPILPSSAYEKYSVMAKKLGLTVPNKYESMIIINNDYEETNVKNMSNLSDIKINSYNTERNQTIDEDKISIQIDSKKTRQVKRGNTMSQFPELNQYSDKMLEYEMGRMMGFKK